MWYVHLKAKIHDLRPPRGNIYIAMKKMIEGSDYRYNTHSGGSNRDMNSNIKETLKSRVCSVPSNAPFIT